MQHAKLNSRTAAKRNQFSVLALTRHCCRSKSGPCRMAMHIRHLKPGAMDLHSEACAESGLQTVE